jgi:hypothetical protein
MDGPSARRPRLAPGALWAVAATAVVYSPQLVIDAGDVSRLPGGVMIAWLVLLGAAAPTVAALVNRSAPAASSALRALAVGVPQVPTAMGLAALDVWLEVRSGYLLAGSGEEAMAYGIGTVVSAIGGLALMLLVAVAAYVAARSAQAKDLGSAASAQPPGPGASIGR